MQLLGLVRAVGVHLTDDVVAGLERVGEAVTVRRAEPALVDPVQHVHLRVGRRQVVGDPAGAVRGVVVHDQHVHVGPGGAQPLEDPGDVVGLLVGGDDHDHAHWRDCTGVRSPHRRTPEQPCANAG